MPGWRSRRTTRYRETLEAAGTSVIGIPGAEDATFPGALRAAVDSGVTAVMAGDDPTAVSALEVLATSGILSPQAVSVTGFDGVGVYRSPLFGLATMRQPVEAMAIAATDIMMRRLDNTQTEPAHEVFRGEYVPGTTLGLLQAEHALNSSA
ncbi:MULTISPECIES: substrate-binding domain-containing protein [unclassified Rathayibacter]|uniref:substrate-binding domain-containing protein n=1 Tax=unclassified Rathayibacter TaxID=2609250 RepID=UPI00104C7DC7|nr:MULTISPECIES: substrate-binding domain-containing protein [unclassified Rathayibacter]MCJ1703756.1 substrate-binding domain-containing protein [Rathayibacter sp. VKM Ac-2926]